LSAAARLSVVASDRGIDPYPQQGDGGGYMPQQYLVHIADGAAEAGYPHLATEARQLREAFRIIDLAHSRMLTRAR